jgi:hypothetical protein
MKTVAGAEIGADGCMLLMALFLATFKLAPDEQHHF